METKSMANPILLLVSVTVAIAGLVAFFYLLRHR